MHENNYDINFDEIAYRKRIKYAAMNGVNTLILTGTGEALQNPSFLRNLAKVLYKEDHPFPNVELQTSGVMLMDSKEVIDELAGTQKKHYHNMELLHDLGVNTISLSISDVFDSDNNWEIIGSPKKYRPSLEDLCGFIKKMGFNLRLSLNMTSVYNDQYPEDVLDACKSLGANQITLRKMYGGGYDNPESIWVDENSCEDKVIERINEYIAGERDEEFQSGYSYHNGEGTPLYRLPFGPMAYSIMGMSVVVDDNCMNKESYDQLKYVILRENGKLYCQWDDEGSLIF
jgi:hypothetical protein